MKHAVILAHPRPRSFTRLLAETYVDEARASGRQAELIDLHAMGFDPRMPAEELPTLPEPRPGADVLAERARLKDVDVFVLVYPIWFGLPPAMLKGYVERVFTAGFGYRSLKGGGLDPLLTGRRLISFTSSGSENAWLVESGAWDALRTAFDQRLAAATGLEIIDHHNFGGVDADLDPALIPEALAVVRGAVRSFSPP